MRPLDSMRRPEVLLVEDNPGDIELVREVLSDAGSDVSLHVVRDGGEALAFLRRRSPHAEVPKPDLILLDLNLPVRDGREVLGEIKADPDLKTIPVVILTSSSAEEDIRHTYALQANCFVTKPVDLRGYRETVGTIESFWLGIATLPDGLAGGAR